MPTVSRSVHHLNVFAEIPTLYCLRQVDSCLHCKFRNGAWRPRAAFQDSESPKEDRIIDIDACGKHVNKLYMIHVMCRFGSNRENINEHG